MASTNYDNSGVTFLKAPSVVVSLLTDGTATLSSGALLGLSGPFTDPTEAVSINYIKPTSIGGEVFDVQYNDDGLLGGSDNLTFNGDTLQINGTLTDGTLSVTPAVGTVGSLIHGVTSPTGPTNLVTKGYVDFYATLFPVTSTTTGTTPVKYAADQIVNTTVTRSAAVPVMDTLPGGTDFTDYLYPYFAGMTFNWYLFNDGPSTVTVQGTTGVTICTVALGDNNPIVVPPGYVMGATLLVVGDGEVAINVDTLGEGSYYLRSPFSATAATTATQSAFQTETPYRVTDVFLRPLVPFTITDSTYSYAIPDYNAGLVQRNPAANAVDTFSSTYPGLLADVSYDFVVQNLSGNTITLQPGSAWRFDGGTSAIVMESTGTGLFTVTLGATSFKYYLSTVAKDW